jgi:NAD(P)-dependent dehydrogenase (short-subunit alcohol dehydrogenase family)
MGNRTMFITGAAAGIGRATATLFAQRGWSVGAYDVDEVGLASLRAELGAERVTTAVLDVTNQAQWTEALEQLFARTGQLDLLVNNAGILASGPFEEIPAALQRKIIDVNVSGVLLGCHSAFPYLRRTPHACVVNLASASAIYGQPSLATYSASKFAVRGLTEALELEWRRHGIRVLDVFPLFVSTGMVRGMNAKSIGRLGVHLTPDDVARTIYRAATSRSPLPRVHWPVGLQSTLSYHLARLSPEWAVRLMNARIGT